MKSLHLVYREPESTRHPMQTFLEESGALERVQLWNWNLSDDELDVVLFRIVGDRNRYERRLAAVPEVVHHSVAPIDDDSFFVYVEHEKRDPDLEFRAAFRGRRIVVVFPIEFTERGAEMTVLGRDAELQAVLDDLPGRIDVDVDYVGPFTRPAAFTPSPLTDRQREALAAAGAVGYYEVPREGTVEDVAERIGCAPSTASNHLRKAEAKLVDQVLE